MSLVDFIRSGNFSTWQDANDALHAKVELRDDKPYTWALVADAVGPVNAEAIRLALESNSLGWASLQLGGHGLSLSDSRVQQALLGFAQAGVPGCAELAAKGITLIPTWQQIGLPRAPIEAEVSNAWTVWNTRQQMAAILQPVQAKSTSVNAWLDAYDLTDKTVEEVQAYVNSLLTSETGNPQ